MLKRQLYSVYIFALFMPILIVGSILIYNNYSMLYAHHEDMLRSDNIRVRSVMFEATTSVINISESIANDDDLKNLVSKDYINDLMSRKALEDFTLISDVYNRYTEISEIKIYTDNLSLISYDHVQVVDDENRAWFNKKISKPGYYWSTYEGVNLFGVKFEELRLLHAITLPNSPYDVLLDISISDNYLKNRIDNNRLDVDIAVNKDPAFFSTWGKSGLVIEHPLYSSQDFYNFSGISNYMGDRSLIEVSTIQPLKTEDSIYIFSRDPHAISEINRIIRLMILIIIISLVLPLFIIVKYTNQLTNRVDTLRNEMHRVTGGDYNIIENFKGHDELVDLFKDLQLMIQSIEERDQAIFEAQIKEQQLFSHQQKTKLELLSSKINPHFLYNTLETIRMKAFNSDNLEVAKAVKLLGRYMRYNLESTGELTTLASEIDYIKVYLNIQRLRFSDRISSEVHNNDNIDLENVKILPLLIQPIIENAFKHGHEETLEGGYIDVYIIDQEEYVLIRVCDNGVGIDDEKRLQLISKLSIPNLADKTSFGLYNIHHRLKLFYGEEFGLIIKSKKDLGTEIEFEIPKYL